MISDPRPLQSLFAGNMVYIIIIVIVAIIAIIIVSHVMHINSINISPNKPSTMILTTMQAREYSRDETTGQWTLDGGWVNHNDPDIMMMSGTVLLV